MISGAIIEVATLMIRGPLSFLVFMFVAGALIFAGMVTYLFSLIGPGHGAAAGHGPAAGHGAAAGSDLSKSQSTSPPQH